VGGPAAAGPRRPAVPPRQRRPQATGGPRGAAPSAPRGRGGRGDGHAV